MNQHDFRVLSAGHALHALSREEAAAFAAALAENPQWQYIVDEDLEVAARLGDSVPEATPPESVRLRVLDAILDLPQGKTVRDGEGASSAEASSAPPIGELPAEAEAEAEAEAVAGVKSAPPRRSRARWVGIFALAASVVLLTAVLVTPRLFEAFAPQDPAVVALQQVQETADAGLASAEMPGGGKATLHWSDSQGLAVLVAEEMAEPPAGEDFELWVVRGGEPTSLGVMTPSDDRRLLLVSDTFSPGDVFAVTVEPLGGSPSGLPTTEPILAIETV